MTGKAMCPCELEDVKRGKQRKSCKKCHIHDCRNMITHMIFMPISLILLFVFHSPILFAISNCMYLWIINARGHQGYESFIDNYYEIHVKSCCEYCFIKPNRSFAKKYVRVLVWSDTISNFIIKWIK